MSCYMKYLLGFSIIIIIVIITIAIVTAVEVGSRAILEGTQWCRAVLFLHSMYPSESLLSLRASCPDPQDPRKKGLSG